MTDEKRSVDGEAIEKAREYIERVQAWRKRIESNPDSAYLLATLGEHRKHLSSEADRCDNEAARDAFRSATWNFGVAEISQIPKFVTDAIGLPPLAALRPQGGTGEVEKAYRELEEALLSVWTEVLPDSWAWSDPITAIGLLKAEILATRAERDAARAARGMEPGIFAGESAARARTGEPSGGIAGVAWTTDEPAEEGWYWYRGWEGPKPSCVYVEAAAGAFWVDEGAVAVDEMPGRVEWLGPITPQTSAAEPSPNEYRPWEEEGITELAYFKRRYLEMSAQVGEPSGERETLRQQLRKAIEGVLFAHPEIDPYDDEKWMVDAMMDGLVNSIHSPVPASLAPATGRAESEDRKAEALRDLYAAIREHHRGQMPEAVEKAYVGAGLVLLDTPRPRGTRPEVNDG